VWRELGEGEKVIRRKNGDTAGKKASWGAGLCKLGTGREKGLTRPGHHNGERSIRIRGRERETVR